MSSKRKSDTHLDKSKKKLKKEESDGEDFDDENDSLSDASNNGADDLDDKSSEPAQEFLPGSEASEKLVSISRFIMMPSELLIQNLNFLGYFR